MNRQSNSKWAAVVLSMAMLTAAACTQGDSKTAEQPKTDGKGQPADAPKAAASGKPQLPLVTKPTELSFFVQLDSKVSATKKSYAELSIFPYLEKETGIKINFVHPPSGMEKEQFNLMVASGELPDMISNNWIQYPGGPAKAVGDGVIIKLNDLVDKYAPNFKKFLNDNPDIKKDVLMDDGTIYAIPLVRKERVQRYTSGLQIRQDWLDKVGMKVPDTMDDWYAVLKAFKEKDPGGTGKVIPFGNSNDLAVRNFMAAWGMAYGFYIVDGKVKYGPNEPDYKPFLTTIKKWYDEGLIDPDFASTDSKQFDAKITGNRIGAYSALLNGGMGRYLDLMKNDPNFKLAGVAPPLTKDGKRYNFQSAVLTGYDGSGVGISSKSKKTEEAIKWLDLGYTEWGHNIFNFGIEGESYNWMNGYPKYTDAVLKHPSLSPTNALSQYTIADLYGRFFNQDERKAEQLLIYPAQKEAGPNWAKGTPERQYPMGVTPTLDEGRKLASIMNEVNTYVDQMFLKFIMGNEPLTKFDDYAAKLKQMKVDEAVSIQQAAYDRYLKR
ncbi:extracellular solute-binding protein [Paenibacillus piri]|uniref:Extracellular solute-binding protein n=1 Tax=Paenibacillus piri TaxID=2547395 RepID=A0A4R5KS81_9BACL|nr:extracellular solute-binding protein [Paenibacillus piri]TDF98699.1 extracellular solute-binding protein [Paenibacillus piri]